MDIGIDNPLRDGGVTCWEGGLRVAAMARWPGHIAAGSVITTTLWSPELLVASERIAGADLPDDRIFSGKYLCLYSGLDQCFTS